MARVTINSRALLPALVFAAAAWAMNAAFARQHAPVPDVVAVDASRPGADISPTMFGVFFEDINFAADGGLYPERIKNRSFEFDEPLAGWARRVDVGDGELTVRTDRPLNAGQPALPARARALAGQRASAYRTPGSAASGSRRAPSTSSRSTRDASDRGRRPLRVDAERRARGRARRGVARRLHRRVDSATRRRSQPPATSARAQFQIVIDQAGRPRPRHGVALPEGHLEEPAATACARTWSSCWPT